jgi:hypothetical protein
MSVWVKILVAGLVLGLLAAAAGFWMDVYGIRRGCFASPLDQARVQLATDLYARANGAVGARQYRVANDMLDKALSILADSYQLGRGTDETQEVVRAANTASARSEFEIAARMKLDVMSRRIWLVQRRSRLSQVCHEVARKWHLVN